MDERNGEQTTDSWLQVDHPSGVHFQVRLLLDRCLLLHCLFIIAVVIILSANFNPVRPIISR